MARPPATTGRGIVLTRLTPCLRAAAALLLIGLAGCTAQTQIDKLYHDARAAAGGYERLLVVGIAGSSSERQQFEDLLVEAVAGRGGNAVAGYTRLGLSPVLLQDSINAAATAAGADGILITHVVSVSTSAEFREGRVEVQAQCRGGDPAEYFLYDYEELKEPDSVAFAHEVVVVTNLYDAESGERVWTIQSTCVDKTELQDVFRQEADAIARQLRRDRLLRAAAG